MYEQRFSEWRNKFNVVNGGNMTSSLFGLSNRKHSWPVWARGLSFLLILFITFAGLPASPVQSETGAVLYVKPGENGDCLSWDTACDLQTALNYPDEIDEIRVAAGTYTPASDGDLTKSFNLRDNVKLYGGYSSDGSQRDWIAYPTILSGDLNGDDSPGLTNYDDNSLHVVKAVNVVEPATLDGFLIRGGNAQGAADDEEEGRGGGIYISFSALNLSNLTIFENRAVSGGGIFNENSSLTLADITIAHNYATGTMQAQGGGGLYNGDSSLLLTNVNFDNNTSYRGGGIFHYYQSEMTISGGLFVNNTVLFNDAGYFLGNSAGGGILVFNANSLRISDADFVGNVAYDGGGITSINSNPIINNVTFQYNRALKPNIETPIYGSGGGFFAHFGTPVLTNVKFIGNTADAYGGGADNYLTNNARYFNTVFYGNSAKYGGGLNHANGSTTISSSTFSSNHAILEGGALRNMDSGSVTLANSVLWGNTTPEGFGPALYNDPEKMENTIINDYSILQDCFTDSWVVTCGTEGANNLYTDPLFVDQAGGDLQLQPDSPAIDSGSNLLIPPDLGDIDGNGDTSEPLPVDHVGNPRVVNDPDVLPDEAIIDRGAYELNTPILTGHNLILTADEDTVVNSQVSASGGGTGLTFSVDTAPTVAGQAFIFNSDGTFSYTPPPNFTGPVIFTFMVTDDLSKTAIAQVSMNFQPVNDPPVNTAPPQVTGTRHVGHMLSATPGDWNDDLDGGVSNITYSYQWQRADDDAGANLVDIAGADEQNYTPVLDDNGKYLRVTVTATDDGVGSPPNQSASAHSAFGLIANAAPLANDLALEKKIDETATGQVSASDPDGDSLTFTLLAAPPKGELFFQSTGNFSYTPPSGFLGKVTFTFTVSDGLGGSDTGAVTLTYTEIPSPPEPKIYLPLIFR